VSLFIVSGCGRRPLPGGGSSGDAGSAAVDASDAPERDQDTASSPCAPGDMPSVVTGTIDHRAVRIESPSASEDGFPVIQESWSILRATSAEEAVLAWGEGDRDGGVQHDAGAVIVVPNASSEGSTYYCAASVDAELTSDAAGSSAAIVLSELSQLGQCPGTPVPGGVVFCSATPPLDDAGAGPCAGGFGVSGTVEGLGLDIRNQGGSVSAGEDALGNIRIDGVVEGNDEGVILLDTDSDGLVTGWLRVPNGSGPNAGTVYCLTDGRPTKLAEHVYSVPFDNVGRLGRCPGIPVDGQLGLCRMY
jgi:hypothetical protein